MCLMDLQEEVFRSMIQKPAVSAEMIHSSLANSVSDIAGELQKFGPPFPDRLFGSSCLRGSKISDEIGLAG